MKKNIWKANCLNHIESRVKRLLMSYTTQRKKSILKIPKGCIELKILSKLRLGDSAQDFG